MNESAFLILCVTVTAAGIWLGLRSMKNRELLPPEPEKERPAREPVLLRTRFAAAALAFTLAFIVVLICLAVAESIGRTFNPQAATYGVSGIVLIAWARPAAFLAPLVKLWRRIVAR